MASWDEIRAASLRLPEVAETEPRSWRVRDKLLAWERPLRRSDLEALGDAVPTGDILGIRTVDLAAKDELLLALPEVFFTTPHFDGHPAVLARLAALDVTVYERLFADVWAIRAPKRAVKAWQAAGGVWLAALLAGLLGVDDALAQQVDLDFETDTFCGDPGATLRVNGDASFGAEPAPCPLVVTSAAGDTVGTAFTLDPVAIGPQTVVRSIFVLEMGGGGSLRGSGMAFVAHAGGANLVGRGGFELGYGGIAPSIAIEFDTYDSGVFDPAPPHLALDRDGAVNGVEWVLSPTPLVDAPVYVWVELHQGARAVQVWVSDQAVRPAAPTLEGTVDLLTDVGADLRFGFTGANGDDAYRDLHVITSWRLEVDDDTDGDGVMDFEDKCDGDDAVGDTDVDGVCDDRDACVDDNPNDSDGDGVCDSDDPCPEDRTDDTDGDGVCDGVDRCPGVDDARDEDDNGVPDCIEDGTLGPDGSDTGRTGREGVAVDPYPPVGGCGCGGGAPIGGGALVGALAVLVRRRSQSVQGREIARGRGSQFMRE